MIPKYFIPKTLFYEITRFVIFQANKDEMWSGIDFLCHELNLRPCPNAKEYKLCVPGKEKLALSIPGYDDQW